MMRSFGLVVSLLVSLSACVSTPPRLGADGLPLPQVFRITEREAAQIPFRFLDAANALRQAANVPQLTLSPELIAAAATHSRDMSVQNRPWHFGSDGSSPIDRVQRAGYTGRMLGENISETYETEIETLAAWMQDPATRAVVLDPVARDVGLAWFQDANGKIWWTMVTGASAGLSGTFPSAAGSAAGVGYQG